MSSSTFARKATSASRYAAICAAAVFAAMAPQPTLAQDKYLGEMYMVANNYCPSDSMDAHGQQLLIAQYSALFALLGAVYGGDGRTTFRLPDLRGRSPVGDGRGDGLSYVRIGEVGGVEKVPVTASNLPAFSSELWASTLPATHAEPGPDRVLAQTQNGGGYVEAAPNTRLASSSVRAAGGISVPLENRPPYLGIRWCIVTQGMFPSRSN